MDRIPPSTYEEARARTDKIRAGFDEIRRLKTLLPPQPKQQPVDERSVYFIQADNGLIKIGVAASPKDRLRTLRTMSPLTLRLVLVLPGCGAPGESELHARFAEHRDSAAQFRDASAARTATCDDEAIAAVSPAGFCGTAELSSRVHRSHGEWFRPAPELISFIQEHK